ncbi:hypothetical protein Nepgr_005771 [Nepenthes gracilis]|uniref:NF-X1-type zinc finger protein NFXL1 n=1 Tax=Nepenthes gracilis TaxID=150966 RepID=A0AAD3S491_NEPGR|nr:hypothetical protein Nepgr_005771 [Nepenthes gracilis]
MKGRFLRKRKPKRDRERALFGALSRLLLSSLSRGYRVELSIVYSLILGDLGFELSASPSTMSFQVRNDQRDRSRNLAQNSHREWVPRSATTISAPLNSTFNANIDGGAMDESSVQATSRQRGTFGSRGRMGRPPNHRRDREGVREKERLKVGRDEVGDEGNGLHLDVPQLLQEIQEKLMKGTVECMICYDMVRRSAPIWSCSSCYSIFHLNCIKKWARAPTSIDLSAEKNQGFNWRCPGCQSVQLMMSKEISYVCFCGKRQDPPSDLYLTPHSCGEPCGKPLEKEVLGDSGSKDYLCPHVCVLQCHPGPCPPCKVFAPPQVCPCGKDVITTKCSDRKSLVTCGQRCDKLLECGRHHCQQICHLGPCEPCKVLVNASCFCRKKIEIILCGDMIVKGDVEVENGLFPCSSTCGKKLGCGNHICGEICHPGPCGEYVGSSFPVDYISVKRCAMLGTVHPVWSLLARKCRCRSTSRNVECYKTTSSVEKFVCEKPCGQKKNCGRHRCSERCCPLSSSKNTLTGDWDPHFCSIPCEKKLRCGQHSCLSSCHSGHCPPCLETIFTDLTCACGRTSIPPPLPCGTPPPSCQYPCSVNQPCGHQSSHSCHFGDCPPCSIPVAKECMGGHVFLRNIPCGSKDIRCNTLCGKTRQCGLHACGRTCHPPPCDSSPASSGSGVITSCGQLCGAPRRDCRHTCVAPCHPSAPCPDLRCEFPVTITCSCGRVAANVPCDSGGSHTEFNVNNVLEASIIQKLPLPLQPVEANGKRIPLGQRKLMCDDECAKLERKKVLADAFDVTLPSLDTLHFGLNPAISDVLSDMLRRDPKWVLSVEDRCKYLVLGKSSRGTTSGVRVHVFCPMLKEKRDAIRLIAERWKLSVNSVGWEPKRFIVIHATIKSRAPPRIFGPKGSTTATVYHQPVFDPSMDMDPRFVVALLDLPSDADISALVLRFGGECELVWLNDKNALAVFSDHARAATAMRRLDHGSVYQGATVLQQTGGAAGGGAVAGSSGVNAWGGAAAASRNNPWKKAVMKEANWIEDSWGEEDWSNGSADVEASSWRGLEPPIAASINQWTVLDADSSSISSVSAIKFEGPGKLTGSLWMKGEAYRKQEKGF